MARRSVHPTVLAAAIVGVLALAPGAHAAKPTRYSLAGGCYSLQSGGKAIAGASKVRMQATALGSYLLYTPARKFLTKQNDGSLAAADDASEAGNWRVTPAGAQAFTLSPHSDPSSKLTVTFRAATGCATYPEIELNAKGTPARGKHPWGEVGGFLEGHNHWMNWDFLGGEFECGRAWHKYGVPYAMPDCSNIEGPQGTAAPVQNTLNYGNPAQPHDTTAWPKFTEWGAHNLTYHGVYWRWVERAWKSGLRMMVMPINENRVLCELLPRKRNPCNEMDAVRRALRDIHILQGYVDAQAGGPGKGFFQVVTTPEAARRVINSGRMAVVLEVEISEPFDCRGWEKSSCTKKQIDRQLNEIYAAGVRSSLLLNKFDNPLTGVRFDSGQIGVLINGGNHQSAGSFWSAQTCKGKLHDNEIYQPSGPLDPFTQSLLVQLGVTGGTVPSYPPAPHCNTRGLTELGKYVVRQMMKRHMVVNPDHMSQAAVDDTLTLLESKRYSGVISPHGWMDPGNWPRLWKLGGLAFPDSDTSPGYVKVWKTYRPRQTPFKLGWGEGADLGGLAQQPDGRAGGVHYPFKSPDGKVTISRQRSGERTFDYNKEGVANYGLYADWFEDVRGLGGQKMAADMWRGAEAYLEMWERADGVPVRGCGPQDRGLTARGMSAVRLGASWESLLRRAGQPQRRDRVWTWCARGDRNATKADVAQLDDSGHVELAGSNGYGRGALTQNVGEPAERLDGIAAAAGHGLYVRAVKDAAFVWLVRNGRVKAVAVVTQQLARKAGALRAAMNRVVKARARQAKRRFIPNATPGSAKLKGASLIQTADPRVNDALAVLCGLK
jgi:hypothetical protein